MANRLTAPPVMPQQAPQAMAQGAPQPQGKQFTMDEVKDLIHKQATIAAKLGALTADDGKATKKDVVQVATELIAERIMSAQEVAGLLKDLPTEPDKIAEWVNQHAANADAGLEQLVGFLAQNGVADEPEMPPEAMGEAVPQDAALAQNPMQ